MKFTEVEELFQNYDQAKWSPDKMEVHFGCGCGCGGSSYTEEQWDREVDDANESIVRMVSFCNLYGIEYDGML